MALTRKFLFALGIEDQKVDEIITAHTEVTDALKAERDKYKADAEKLPGVQAELDGLKSKDDGNDPWKVKYDAIKEEYDQYKTAQTEKETKAAKESAYRAILKEAGVAERRLDAVLKVTNLDGITLNKDGSIKDAESVKEGIKAEWSDFIQTTQTVGANTATPPANNGNTLKTREEIYKRDESGRFVYDAAQRQEALAQLINQKG